jgi:excisionase family DNA binding protein
VLILNAALIDEEGVVYSMKDIRDGEQHRSTADMLSPRGTPSISLSATERLYTPQEVADRLGVSERWVRDHATRRNPRIRAIKLGPLLRFRWIDVEQFVAAQTTDISGFKKLRQRS